MTDDDARRWLDRLTKETAAVRRKEASVVAWMRLAEVRFNCGLPVEAAEALVRSLSEFESLKPVRWAILVERAADLCERLDANYLLEGEAERGAAWRAQPKIVLSQTALPDAARRIALQSGRLELVGDGPAHDPLDSASRKFLDDCRIAGWQRDARRLKQSIGPTIDALEATDAAASRRRQLFSQLTFACRNAALLDEAAKFVRAGEYPYPAVDETLIALRKAGKRKGYDALRDDWFQRAIQRFEVDPEHAHWRSSEVRRCISTMRGLGDSAHVDATSRFRRAVEGWQPDIDRNGCAVRCDLAVLSFDAETGDEAAQHLEMAHRYFDGQEPVPTARGNKVLMASMLSAAYRDIGDTEAAMQYARKLTVAGDRFQYLFAALLRGGRIAETESELARLSNAEARADAISGALMTAFNVGSSAEFLLTDRA